jgi:hypothetical protein
MTMTMTMALIDPRNTSYTHTCFCVRRCDALESRNREEKQKKSQRTVFGKQALFPSQKRFEG